MKHRIGEDFLPGVSHAVQVNRHQQRANLIVGNATTGYAVDKERDFFWREFLAISLLPNHVLRSQDMSPLFFIRTTADADTARPSPTASSPSDVFAFMLTFEISTPSASLMRSRIV